MGLLKIKRIILVCLLAPFILANKECKRSTTWGEAGESYVSLWEADHADLEKDTKCSECHDDKRSSTSPPKSHNSHDIVWKREHGKFAHIKYGYRSQNICQLCHKETWCMQCHLEEKPPNHNEFWKQKGHGLMVGLDRSRCNACHMASDFCERCHSETKPTSHDSALWGNTRNNHCGNCHLPLQPTVADSCGVCHSATPAHDSAPPAPPALFHQTGADCLSCHTPLPHADNGTDCTTCHAL